jgi:hypothetical protein
MCLLTGRVCSVPQNLPLNRWCSIWLWCQIVVLIIFVRFGCSWVSSLCLGSVREIFVSEILIQILVGDCFFYWSSFLSLFLDAWGSLRTYFPVRSSLMTRFLVGFGLEFGDVGMFVIGWDGLKRWRKGWKSYRVLKNQTKNENYEKKELKS